MTNQQKMCVNAVVVERSQKRRGGSRRFGGPDRYVAVCYVPDDVELPQTLNHNVLSKRGIGIEYCGEGYSLHAGPKSSLGKARAKAQQLAEEFNNA